MLTGGLKTAKIAMIDIKINIDNVINQYNLDKDQATEAISLAVDRVAERIHESWISAAGKALKSTRAAYIQGLKITDTGRLKRTITLHGSLNNLIENGCSAFDMKQHFMKSAKVKYGKNGWYLTIPFRHSVPSALAENAAFSNRMPQAVYNVAKKLAPTTTQPNSSKTAWGGRLKDSQLPKAFQKPLERAGVSALLGKKTFNAYQHKSSIYSGMVKQQKTYQNATQSTYTTFRRVGAKSDPNSWIHSGFIAKNLAVKAKDGVNVGFEAKIAIGNYLQNLGF